MEQSNLFLFPFLGYLRLSKKGSTAHMLNNYLQTSIRRTKCIWSHICVYLFIIHPILSHLLVTRQQCKPLCCGLRQSFWIFCCLGNHASVPCLISSAHPGPGHRGSCLNRQPLSSHLYRLLQGVNIEVFPNKLRDMFSPPSACKS